MNTAKRISESTKAYQCRYYENVLIYRIFQDDGKVKGRCNGSTFFIFPDKSVIELRKDSRLKVRR